MKNELTSGPCGLKVRYADLSHRRLFAPLETPKAPIGALESLNSFILTRRLEAC